jgi:hypothetical protein
METGIILKCTLKTMDDADWIYASHNWILRLVLILTDMNLLVPKERKKNNDTREDDKCINVRVDIL